MIGKPNIWATFALTVTAMAACAPAFAQAVDPGKEYGGIIDTFYGTGAWISAALFVYAQRVFAMLFTIQLVWGLMQTVLKDNGGWSDIVEFFVKQAMYFGFFYALLLNSYAWGDAIVRSFRMAGARAVTSIGGTGSFAPIDVFLSGFDMAGSLLKEMSMWPTNYAANLVILLCALGLVLMCGYISILISMAIIESSVVIGAATLLMGFGGGQWTKDIAISTLRFAFSIGAKIFMMQIIVGVAFAPLKSWAARIGGINVLSNLHALFVIVGLVFFVVMLCKKLPDMIQAMINGTASPTTGGAGVAGAAAAIAGAGMAVAAAGKLAAAQQAAMGPAAKSLSGQGSAGGAAALGHSAMGMLGQGATLAGMMGSNLLKAGLNDVGGKLTGRNNFGTMGGRMANEMNDAAKAAKSKPTMPTSENKPNANVGGMSAASTGGSIGPGAPAAAQAPTGSSDGAPLAGRGASSHTPASTSGGGDTSMAAHAAGAPNHAADAGSTAQPHSAPDASVRGPAKDALNASPGSSGEQDGDSESHGNGPGLGGALSGTGSDTSANERPGVQPAVSFQDEISGSPDYVSAVRPSIQPDWPDDWPLSESPAPPQDS